MRAVPLLMALFFMVPHFAAAPDINQQRAKELFLRLARIDSGKENEALICSLVERLLRDLGAEWVLNDEVSKKIGGTGGNIFAFFKGTAPAPPLLLSAHLDTVLSTENIQIVERDEIIATDGTTILGADDKAGVALILEVLQTIKEKSLPCPPLEVLFTIREEKGLLGAKVFDLSQIKARYGLVVDGGGTPGELIIASPTHRGFEVTFYGKSAHAGAEPERGINAIAMAAFAIAQVPWGRLDEETTANVGIISGGAAMNIVPDRCTVIGEVRSHQEEKVQQVLNRLRDACTASVAQFGGKMDWKEQVLFHGYRLTEEEPIVATAVAAVQELGLKPRLTKMGGGTDANVFAKGGIRCLVLPTGGRDHHSTKEHLILPEFYLNGRILLTIVMHWARGEKS
ncbi:MAG: M20/M25/M40 family metallo-hydrolase [Armatimonadetes bacterium]|nr:M20/M25/M40 family metallo-hydrolase [Armatimonadota bacterium]MDW8121092.1 M20/M25/M40 family metallo-hydrolase [Armatimonadota bacterium]